MSRFVKDIHLGCPEDAVEEVVQDYLTINDFHKTEWNGEHIWGKDAVYAPNYRLFDYRYENGSLHIEAFLRHGKSGELDLNGYESMRDRKAYLESIIRLLRNIVALVPEESGLSVESILGEAEGKALKRYRILWPVILLLILMFVLLPYLFR